MIDVIFLLLTFFIYSLVLMVKARVLPVELTPITAGQTAQPQQIVALTIDRGGDLFWDREPVDTAALPQRLAQLMTEQPSATLFLAMESRGVTDRGPLLLKLIETVRASGLERFVIVGQDESETPPSPEPLP